MDAHLYTKTKYIKSANKSIAPLTLIAAIEIIFRMKQQKPDLNKYQNTLHILPPPRGKCLISALQVIEGVPP